MTMNNIIYDKCKEYYPRLWNKSRIDALYKANKISKEEYDNIINNEEKEQ